MNVDYGVGNMNKKLKHTHRELKLLEILRMLGGSARSAELANALDVSEETVRRTIKVLSKSGALERMYGGAYLAGHHNVPSFFRRVAKNPDQKDSIATATIDQVRDGMTLFLDAGSTTSFVAEKLRQRLNLTVATNSIGVAQVLANHNGNHVHLLGGEMQNDERGTFGFVAEQQARRFAYDLAILSVDALSETRGFLYQNASEANLASVIGKSSERVLVAVDHSKFVQIAPHRGLNTDLVTEIVTDQEPPLTLRRAINDWDIKIHLADGGEPVEQT